MNRRRLQKLLDDKTLTLMVDFRDVVSVLPCSSTNKGK